VPLLEKIHGSTQHLGKIPHKSGEAFEQGREMLELRQALKLAVDQEDYEQAAKLRDRIRAIEEGGHAPA
jgi:protein arginine kinase activator